MTASTDTKARLRTRVGIFLLANYKSIDINSRAAASATASPSSSSLAERGGQRRNLDNRTG